jgi:phosphoribosyl 1,2-cyclic phosphodiesterase
MRIRFWGVRGSIPVPGPQTNRYGGNTSCVEIQPRNGPRIIIDAGTGIRKLGKELMQGPFGEGKGAAHLLISHTHWDHIQGMPFFAPMYQAGNQLYVYARQRDDSHLRAVFAAQSDDPYFPAPFNTVKADVAFRELVEGARFQLGDTKVACTRLNHPWVAMAYRLEADGASVVYCTDTAPFTDILLENEFIRQAPRPGDPLPPEHKDKLREMRDHLVALCKHADLLIYDTQFTQAEYQAKPHWGHSTPQDAIEIAHAAKVKTLALFHHDPTRTDDQQDQILVETRHLVAGSGLDVIAAAEQLELVLGAH